jgi:CheY-like chemotaxis protein
MPKKDGMQTLHEIRNNQEIRTIPVVVLTTSRHRDLMLRICRLGGSAFITKPAVYKDMVKTMERLCAYWVNTVSLPDHSQAKVQYRKPVATRSKRSQSF